MSKRFIDLQSEWLELMKVRLPQAAKSHKEWPIRFDHCFGRIIMDNAVGKDTPWMEKVKSPAYKHMSESQLQACISLGNLILEEKEDLNELNLVSLKLRNKIKR